MSPRTKRLGRIICGFAEIGHGRLAGYARDSGLEIGIIGACGHQSDERNTIAIAQYFDRKLGRNRWAAVNDGEIIDHPRRLNDLPRCGQGFKSQSFRGGLALQDNF